MKKIVFLAIVAILISSCRARQQDFTTDSILNWQYSDLRLLDPSDAQQPDQDLVALYTRLNGQSLQIRIDFLGLSDLPDSNLYIAFDTNPGGQSLINTGSYGKLSTDLAWDYLIKIPASRKVEFLGARSVQLSGASLFIVRDVSMGSIMLSFNQSALPINPGRIHLQVIVTPKGQDTVVDKSEIFSIDAPSPARAKVFLAFWNTFDSVTPAQTLRSWDGAHSGPMRNRHGLRYLLDALDQSRANITIFDLLDPDTLSALDYLGALPQVQRLVSQGYLELPDISQISSLIPLSIFPDFAAGQEKAYPLNLIKEISTSSNLSIEMLNKSSNLYLLMRNNDLYMYLYKILSDNDYANNSNINCPLSMNRISFVNTVTPLPDNCKKLFLSNAIGQPTYPIILGGDFATSYLGDPAVIYTVLAYIKSHPWIRILSLSEFLLDNNVVSRTPPPYSEEYVIAGAIPSNMENYEQIGKTQTKIYSDLQLLPQNHVSEIAWRVYQTFLSPSTLELADLRTNYLGQIGEIIAAAQWSDDPAPYSGCDRDLDYDKVNECILATNDLFVIIEPDGGYIPFVFSMDPQGVHQIIGPIWEFLVGLSDPSIWDLTKDVRGDPDQQLGIMSDTFSNWNHYEIVVDQDKMVLYNHDMTIRKTVVVNRSGLQVQVEKPMSFPINGAIPLVVDPWTRYRTGWGDRYSGVKSNSSYQWGIQSGLQVKISSTSEINAFPFNATHSRLDYPEDPNFDYSPGHYLPFPMALVEISPSESYSFNINILP